MTLNAGLPGGKWQYYDFVHLEAQYWYDVDRNWGRSAHTFYWPDAKFTIGEKVLNGPEEIAAFYKWRESRGERVARHLVTNFHLSVREDRRTELDCVLMLYAADGRPPLPSEPAVMIADIHSEFELGDDNRWRFRSHSLTPIFTGKTPATLPPS